MKTQRWVLAAILTGTVACSGEVEDAGSSEASNEAAAAASTSPGIEMQIDWEARAELQAALGKAPKNPFDYADVTVPGVVTIQHQYSIAALRLEARSWSIQTGMPTANPGPNPPGIDLSLAVAFPRRPLGMNTPEFFSSELKAKTLFQAMVAATETTAQIAPNAVAKIRTSSKGTFRCTKTTSIVPKPRTEYDCVIRAVGEVGGPGLILTP